MLNCLSRILVIWVFHRFSLVLVDEKSLHFCQLLVITFSQTAVTNIYFGSYFICSIQTKNDSPVFLLCFNKGVYISLITQTFAGSKTRAPEDRTAWRSQNNCWAETHSCVISQCTCFLITLAGRKRHGYFSSGRTLSHAALHDSNSHRTTQKVGSKSWRWEERRGQSDSDVLNEACADR